MSSNFCWSYFIFPYFHLLLSSLLLFYLSSYYNVFVSRSNYFETRYVYTYMKCIYPYNILFMAFKHCFVAHKWIKYSCNRIAILTFHLHVMLALLKEFSCILVFQQGNLYHFPSLLTLFLLPLVF